jgi:hypothetical protein
MLTGSIGPALLFRLLRSDMHPVKANAAIAMKSLDKDAPASRVSILYGQFADCLRKRRNHLSAVDPMAGFLMRVSVRPSVRSLTIGHAMSALPPQADMCSAHSRVRFWLEADIASHGLNDHTLKKYSGPFR